MYACLWAEGQNPASRWSRVPKDILRFCLLPYFLRPRKLVSDQTMAVKETSWMSYRDFDEQGHLQLYSLQGKSRTKLLNGRPISEPLHLQNAPGWLLHLSQEMEVYQCGLQLRIVASDGTPIGEISLEKVNQFLLTPPGIYLDSGEKICLFSYQGAMVKTYPKFFGSRHRLARSTDGSIFAYSEVLGQLLVFSADLNLLDTRSLSAPHPGSTFDLMVDIQHNLYFYYVLGDGLSYVIIVSADFTERQEIKIGDISWITNVLLSPQDRLHIITAKSCNVHHRIYQ